MDAPVDRLALARQRAPATGWLSVTRIVGLGLLGICAIAALRLHTSVFTWPRHPPSVAEMLLSLATVLTGMGGALATLVGPSLFHSHPRPPRLEL